MQLTRYTDFSLRVLMYLTVQPREQRVTVSDISEQFAIPRNHLVKIVHQLGQKGYIITRRGKGGGISLACEPAEINVGSVIRDMEPNLNVVDCENPVCPILPGCQLRGVLNDARDAFLAVLDRYTIADVTQAPDYLYELLHPGKSA
ncbi:MULTISPECIES: Rrf2 family transcriptional regulator [unclassified Thioalkalivibrio]|uniref:Rrf2 family transcriptional regulator n=1 Tax=unclassified Thioalkalivibrio TaxID=2621013 RepID=UPI000367A883|nr:MULTISPECIES: Rrf2 family transcriptional regulator [unclassified Thioalkalivibrio]